MIARLGTRALRADILGPVLVFLSLQMLAYGLSSSLLGMDNRSLYMICLAAAALGWGLSKTKLRAAYAAILLAGLGLAGIWIAGARLTLPLFGWPDL